MKTEILVLPNKYITFFTMKFSTTLLLAGLALVQGQALRSSSIGQRAQQFAAMRNKGNGLQEATTVARVETCRRITWSPY